MALMLAILPSAALSQARAAAAPLSRAEQLDIMADYFRPRVIYTLMRERCDTGYRTHLAGDPALADAEKAMPGLINRMVETAAAYCDREMAALVDTSRDKARAYWATEISPAALARVAKTLAPLALSVRKITVEAHPGESFEVIRDRCLKLVNEQKRLAMQAKSSFAVAPGDAPLAAKVKAYAIQSDKEFEEDPHGLGPIGDDSEVAAMQAANLYAHEKGFQDIFSKK
jgi:hypothetical protein